jgi:DNA mismatch repair protein MutS2
MLAKLNKYFTRDGKLREEASAELRAIRQRVQQKRGAIQRVLNDVMNRAADAIQEPLIVMRGDRYCIPVRADHRNAVPASCTSAPAPARRSSSSRCRPSS